MPDMTDVKSAQHCCESGTMVVCSVSPNEIHMAESTPDGGLRRRWRICILVSGSCGSSLPTDYSSREYSLCHRKHCPIKGPARSFSLAHVLPASQVRTPASR